MSEAFAEIVTVPDSVSPTVGAVMETVGGVVSATLFVENAASLLIVSIPAEFFERTR